jgi:Polyketide cyclase / dehydrase and lipid transport
MKAIKILIILAVLFVIGGFVLPSDYSVSRSVTINGSKDQIHEYIGDLDKWPEWSPWKKADSSIIIYPGDSSSGMGASQTWKGDSGSGSMIITDSSEDDGIKYDMVLDGKDKAKGSISYRGAGEMTQVTWSMTGNMENTEVTGPYIAMSMDFIVGKMFSEGLDDLKKIIDALNDS